MEATEVRTRKADRFPRGWGWKDPCGNSEDKAKRDQSLRRDAGSQLTVQSSVQGRASRCSSGVAGGLNPFLTCPADVGICSPDGGVAVWRRQHSRVPVPGRGGEETHFSSFVTAFPRRGGSGCAPGCEQLPGGLPLCGAPCRASGPLLAPRPSALEGLPPERVPVRPPAPGRPQVSCCAGSLFCGHVFLVL